MDRDCPTGGARRRARQSAWRRGAAADCESKGDDAPVRLAIWTRVVQAAVTLPEPPNRFTRMPKRTFWPTERSAQP